MAPESSRKGISPLIAAVMLLTFVMVIGGMFSVWSQELVKKSQKTTTNSSGEIRSCSTIVLEVIEKNSSFVRLQQVSGERAVGNITVSWFYENNIKQSHGEIRSKRGITDFYSGKTGNLQNLRIHTVNCEEASVNY